MKNPKRKTNYWNIHDKDVRKSEEHFVNQKTILNTKKIKPNKVSNMEKK